MKQFALKGIMISFAVLAMISIYFFALRLKMPFNSEGNYFDQETTTVYHDDSVLIYGLITFILTILAIISFIASRKSQKT